MARCSSRFTSCAVILTTVTLITIVYDRRTELPANQTSDSARTPLDNTDRNCISNRYPPGKIASVGVFVLINARIGDRLAGLENSTNSRRPDDHPELVLSNCDESPGGYKLYVIYTGTGDANARELLGLYIAERVKLISQRGCQVTVASERDATTATTGNYMQALNELMITAHLDDGVDYFHVISHETTESNDIVIARNNTHLISQLRLRTDLYETGIVVEQQRTSNNGPSVPVAIFFTRVHFDIFGIFFPLGVPNLSSAISLTTEVYLSMYDIANLTVIVKHGASDIDQDLVNRRPMKNEPSTSSAKQSWPDLFKQDSETLQRYLSVAISAKCFRCPSTPSSGLRVISMSLYGSSRRYTMGAIRNAQLAPVNYPGWQLRFFTELPGPIEPKRGVVPQGVLDRLRELGAVLHDVQPPVRSLAPMLWRFTVADDPTVDLFIVRDCDSRLTPRDSAVVNDWLKQDPTKSVFHCIRDHPSHSSYSVSGGLWGARRPELSALFNGSFSASMVHYGAGYVEDMNFLGRDVWPRVQSVAYCHDSFSCQTFPSSHPFPVKRIGSEHLGEVYDQFSVGRDGDIAILLKAGVKRECVP